MSAPRIFAATIAPGYLIRLKNSKSVLKTGTAIIKPDDTLRCISREADLRLFIVRRTRTTVTFTLSQLATYFQCIGFEGLEDIVESSTVS